MLAPFLRTHKRRFSFWNYQMFAALASFRHCNKLFTCFSVSFGDVASLHCLVSAKPQIHLNNAPSSKQDTVRSAAIYISTS
jgi:hypothetical protein